MSNPFGNYDKGTMGHILNALHAFGIPITTVENLILSTDQEVYMGSKLYAKWRYFDDIEQPLFYFTNEFFMTQKYEMKEDSSLVPKFVPLLTIGRQPCFYHQAPVSENLRNFLINALASKDGEWSEVNKKCLPRFKTGKDNTYEKDICITFSESDGLEEWFKLLNTQYDPN